MDWLSDLHSVWRWVIFAAAAIALVLSALAAIGTRPWDSLSDRFSFFFTIAVDVQVLIGAVLWLLNQGWTREPFMAFVHPVLMLGAVALAHIGRARSERSTGDRSRGRVATVFFLASVVVMVIAIPTASWPI
jgi:hypothetical protein